MPSSPSFEYAEITNINILAITAYSKDDKLVVQISLEAGNLIY